MRLAKLFGSLVASTLVGSAFAQTKPAGSGEPFIDNATAGAQLRSLYFYRDTPTAVQETWALGGWVWGRTGYWRDFLQFGGTVYGAFPLYGPTDHDGGNLVKPGQNSFAVVGEAYGRLKWWEQTATLYRQRIGVNPQTAQGVRSLQTDLNYLGSRDIRMAPLTYEAAMFNGPINDQLRYQAGYVANVKDINADHFVSMSKLAGVTTKDAGLWNAGVQWSPVKDTWVQGFYYYVEDTIKIAYADVDWVNRTSNDTYYRLAAQYSDQRSDGANLLGSFNTWNVGGYGEYGWRWLTLYGALSSTGEGAAIRNPWSFGPAYIGQRIKTFTRAGEDALMIGSTFDLASFGMPGFRFDFNIADGRGAIDPATKASLPNWREYDTDFIYRFAKESKVPGMQIRLRWATVREDFGSRVDRTDDFRVDLNWAITFK